MFVRKNNFYRLFKLKVYLKENPDYLEKQEKVNKELLNMLMKNEGQEIVLQDNIGDKFDDLDLPEEKVNSCDHKNSVENVAYFYIQLTIEQLNIIEINLKISCTFVAIF